MINWQLSKQNIRPYRGFRCPPIVQTIASSSLWFLIHTKYVVFVSLSLCTRKILISNWPRTRKFSQLFKKRKQVGKTFSYHGHALITLYVQFLCSSWSKFDRWVHAENLYSILKLVYFDSWSCHRFVSTCDAFNCLLPLGVQNEIQLLSEVFCYSWLVYAASLCLCGKFIWGNDLT